MRISGVRSYVLPADGKEWVVVLVDTEQGLTGVGEATLEYRAASVAGALTEAGEYLEGKDPTEVERHWNELYQGFFWRGGPVQMTALGALDQALWDIAGKALEVPVHRLFGGPVRDRVRVYLNQWFRGATNVAGLVAKAREAVGSGARALKWYPFRFSPLTHLVYSPPRGQLRSAVAQVEAVREAVGPEVELAVDLSSVPDPATAEQFCRLVVDAGLLFVEEPIPPENTDALARFSARVPIPIASGERLYSRWDFRPLIEKQAVAFVQPDPCHCGGLSESLRVAAMAETYFMGVVPHNPNGPVSTAACLQLAASIPNFVILEAYPDSVPDIRQRILAEPLLLDGDAYRLPEGPGLGVTVDEDALRALQVTATGHHGRRPRRLWSLSNT